MTVPAWGVGLVILLELLVLPVAVRADSRPSVVVILMDTTRADRFGAISISSFCSGMVKLCSVFDSFSISSFSFCPDVPLRKAGSK